MPPRILILQLKRLGDVVLTAPLVAAIREGVPEAEITLVTKDAGGEIASLFEGVDQQLIFRSGQVNAALMRHLVTTSYDWSLDLTGNDRSAFLSFLSGAKNRAGYRPKSLGFKHKAYTAWCEASVRDLHTVDYHLAMLELMGFKSQFQGWAMRPFPEPNSEPYVLIHPGTAREEKYWRPERWAEVIRFIHERGFGPIRLTHGADAFESEHVDAILREAEVPIDRMTGLSLRDFVQTIAQARLLLSVDTVAPHIATAYERPLVVLYGPTNPYHWRPRHAQAKVIWAGRDQPVTEFRPKADQPPMDEIQTATVLRAIESLLSG